MKARYKRKWLKGPVGSMKRQSVCVCVCVCVSDMFLRGGTNKRERE